MKKRCLIHQRILSIMFGIFFSIACLAFPKQMYVAAESLNVRSEPTTDSQVAFKLTRNAQVQVLDTLNAWGAIQHPDYPGETFWISMDFLSEQPVTDSKNEDSSPEEDGLSTLLAICGIIVWLIVVFSAPKFWLVVGFVAFLIGWLSG